MDVQRIEGFLLQVKEQTTKTNGRVTKLEQCLSTIYTLGITRIVLLFKGRMGIRLNNLIGLRFMYNWRWDVKTQGWKLKLPFGRVKATVWPNGTWCTWDKDGCGLENSIVRYGDFMPFEDRHYAAKREAWESCEKQKLI